MMRLFGFLMVVSITLIIVSAWSDKFEGDSRAVADRMSLYRDEPRSEVVVGNWPQAGSRHYNEYSHLRPRFWPFYGLVGCALGFWLSRGFQRKRQELFRACVVALAMTPFWISFHGKNETIYSAGYYLFKGAYHLLPGISSLFDIVVTAVLSLIVIVPMLFVGFCAWAILRMVRSDDVLSHIGYIAITLSAGVLLLLVQFGSPWLHLRHVYEPPPRPPVIYPNAATDAKAVAANANQIKPTSPDTETPEEQDAVADHEEPTSADQKHE